MMHSGGFFDDLAAALLQVTFRTAIKVANRGAAILTKNEEKKNYFVNKK